VGEGWPSEALAKEGRGEVIKEKKILLNYTTKSQEKLI
jgi:hypothetical protein